MGDEHSRPAPASTRWDAVPDPAWFVFLRNTARRLERLGDRLCAPWNRLKASKRSLRIRLVAVLVLVAALGTAGIVGAVQLDEQRIANLVATSSPGDATVLEQDLDDCSLVLDLDGAAQEARTDCSNTIYEPGQTVRVVSDPRSWPELIVVGPDQDWQGNAEYFWTPLAICGTLMGVFAWFVAYQLLLKHDRDAVRLRAMGVKPPPGAYERGILRLQFAPQRVRYGLLLGCAALSVGLAFLIASTDNNDLQRDQRLLKTEPRLEATLIEHGVDGKGGYPDRVQLGDQRVELSRRLPNSRSLQLGDTVLVIRDPQDPDIVTPVNFMDDWWNKPGGQAATALFALVPGAMVMGVAFRVLASRRPLSAFEPETADGHRT
ncbi:hypothetical protein [Paeniglutamicibacter kerguelensis]|uniref:DUF3592 domain-containing protein n=1 Tax=Paeniglutamicibacter kerguelensis TaxID=254788 RepID=A0ABS4XEZ3_9MICC|nr:hypothetical protein [Paeniglutamicibacter kerguelensis]MBP2386828.1 hypothetical protein [Paeniglutamicibacter kerguelensis]